MILALATLQFARLKSHFAGFQPNVHLRGQKTSPSTKVDGWLKAYEGRFQSRHLKV